MRRVWMGCVLLAGLLSSLPLMATDEERVPLWTCSDDFKGETLSIANWTTYIAPDTISNFEALCQVTVNYVEFEDDAEILTALRRGDTTYDLVVPDNSTVGVMIEEGLLEALDHTNIPNLKNLDPIFDSAAYDPGHIYSVPYQWGSIGVGYRKSDFPTPPTSWNDIFEYEGKSVWLDSPRAIIGIALLAQGLNPASGDPEELAQARNFLIDHSARTLIAPDSTAQNYLADGEAGLVIEYSGDILQLNTACECDDFVYLIPEEGSNIWVDSMVVPADVEHKALAEAFIDYILDPVVGADISNATRYATPNKTAIDEKLVNEDLLNNPAIYPFQELREKMFFLTILTPDQITLYDDAWREVKLLADIDVTITPTPGS